MPIRHLDEHATVEVGSRDAAKAIPVANDSVAAPDGGPRTASSLQARLEGACDDLRQPLQSLVLLHGLLARSVKDPRQLKLCARMDTALTILTAVVADLADAETDADTISPPVSALARARDRVAAPRSSAVPISATANGATVFVVDDDTTVRDAIASVLEADGYVVITFDSCEAFLAHSASCDVGCLLVDAYLPGMSGLALLQKLQSGDSVLPAIMITGNSDVPMAVQAMKAGAVDFIEKPIGRCELVGSINRALEHARDQNQLVSWRRDAATQLAALTSRQREIMDMVLAGQPSKNIAADLGISQRTVENHRASIMRRTGVKSLPALARLALAASSATPELPARPQLTSPPRIPALPSV